MNPIEILSFLKKTEHKYTAKPSIDFIDFKFCDLLGTWQHFTIPSRALEESVFEKGLGFDGSSIRGWKSIDESDMIAIPDPSTFFIDPINHEIGSMICDIVDPVTKERYTRDPRNIAKKAEKFMKSVGVADNCFVGPEAEFYIFNGIRFESSPNKSFYEIKSVEGRWNTGHEESLGHNPNYQGGYFPVPPTDHYQEMRNSMVSCLQQSGIEIENHHHEVGTAGQSEIDMKFGPMLKIADDLMKYKYIVKNVAKTFGQTVTFMPKPIYGDNGSGMHVHISLWKDNVNLMAGNEYAGLSEIALYFIGGLLAHAPAILAFAAPSTNSYKRLVPGYEAPVKLAYSQGNRSAACRIPMYEDSANSKRVEFRPPDPSCNPYLTFSAMLMAGLDGILKQTNPGEPLDKNLYDLPPEEEKLIREVPRSLDLALKALEQDSDFLLKGNVFTQDVIEEWISYKKNEVSQIDMRPHPYEFDLYYDV